ncbi:hypothetical protein D1867_00795 [Acidianus infernus]|uniref:Uncharacterized protein n=1 Tax=Acidianus infernus TaxID=12915 RepID=A0A6A9QEX6_ACIIN|nr:hypothetical protein [Acidianus infernus]MCY0873435.1 hypothetical protein [Acidianus infernus]MUM63816.1 hypothetical protein [Acidianus infernus]
MFEDLLKVVNYLNDGKILEAGEYLVELAKNNYTNEDIIKISSEIEKELRELKEESWITQIDSKFRDQIISVLEDNTRCKRELIRVLSLSLLEKLSKGNELILNMIRNPHAESKPHTFI